MLPLQSLSAAAAAVAGGGSETCARRSARFVARMHLRRCQTFQRRAANPWEVVTPRELSDADRRALFGVADVAVVASAGRTTMAMVLRGSRAEKVRRLGFEGCRGHGHFAGMNGDEVLARIDTVIQEGALAIEWNREGMPLLRYTEAGLEEAVGYAADEWLEELRAVVGRGAEGVGGLSFLKDVGSRNTRTALVLAERTAEAATPEWLPLLRAWREREVKRVRAVLAPVIERLERAGG